MDSLGELLSACRAADTEKVTERKRQLDRIHSLLTKGYILKDLDRNSDLKSKDPKQDKKLFGWDSLFKAVKRLMWYDVEALQKAKNPDTPAMLKRKQDILSLLKKIIRQADQRGGHRLKASDAVTHIVHVMRDENARRFFGYEFTSVLLKDILTVRKYWCELEQNTWQELLCLYGEMLLEPPATFDRVVIARIIHCVIEGATKQGDVRGKRILPLLEKFFLNVKKSRHVSVLEHIMSALNVLCRAIAIDGRQQICRLGEEIALPLLFIWHNHPTEKLKTELIAFFQLQMVAHHPQGAKTPAEGAFALDWDKWKSNMRKLYEALYNDLQEFGSRHRFATGIRESTKCELSENLLHLTADVCHQLYTEQGTSVDVTQVSFLAESGPTQLSRTQMDRPSKKRRLESGWQALQQAIAENRHTYLVVPWLQLLSCLLTKYPCTLPEEEYTCTLSTLSSVVQQSKKVECTRWVFRCLISLANSQIEDTDRITEFTTESCQAVWKKVSSAALRCISLHHAQNTAYKLLTTLTETKLLKPESDIWNLFIPNLTKPSQAAVIFLLTYLKHFDLPEQFSPQYLANIVDYDVEDASELAQKYPLRKQLLSWLLPGYDVTDESASALSKHRSDTDESSVPIQASSVVQLLMALIQRDTRPVISNNTCESTNLCSNLTDLSSIEDIYLQTSFHNVDQNSSEKERKAEVDRKGVTVISCVEKQLMELLQRDCTNLLEIIEPHPDKLMLISTCVCTSVQALSQLHLAGVYSTEQIVRLQLTRHLQELIGRLNTQLCDVIRKDGLQGLTPVLPMLNDLFSSQEDRYKYHALIDMRRAVFQKTVVDAIAKLLKEKPKVKRSDSTLTTASNSVRRPSTFDEFDAMDTQSSAASSSTTNTNGADELDEDFGEMSQNTMSEESDGFTSSDIGSASLLCTCHLSDKEQVKLQLVQVFCKWTLGKHTNPEAALLKTEVTYECILEHVLDLLDSSLGFDPSRAFDLQMVEVVVKEMSVNGNKIADDLMDSILDALKMICKTHRKDQDICTLVIQLLDILVPHFSTPQGHAVSECVSESRAIALHILYVFWCGAERGEYGKQTRMVVAQCMTRLAQHDPAREWARWKVKGAESADVLEFHCLHDKFIECVTDPHHAIRLLAARAIKYLFVSDNGENVTPSSANEQHKAFNLIYTSLQETLNTHGRLSADEQVDETENRTSSMLHTLMTIACHSAVCERQAVFAVCQMAKERNLPADAVVKVLNVISKHLRYENLQKFMTSHMAYLVQQWLESGYSIIEIPHQLFGYKSTTHLFKDQLHCTISFLVLRCEYEMIKQVAKLFGTDTTQLLQLSLIDTLVHILPLFAVSKMADPSLSAQVQKRAQKVSTCYDALLKHVPQQMVEQHIVRYMPELVIKVLLTLHDTRQQQGDATSSNTTRSITPEPNPPVFSREMIECTLSYISSCHGASSLVAGLTKQHQDGIQKILLALCKALSLAHVLYEKCRLLRVYQLFVQLLLREFHEQLGGSWAFVLRDTLHTLLHNITAVRETSAERKRPLDTCEKDFIFLSLEILKSVCQVGLESCPKELGMFLPVMVGALVPRTGAQENADVKNQCEKLLTSLLVENAANLREAVSVLDPLPKSDALKKARDIQRRIKYAGGEFTLKQEIEHFLSAGNAGVDSLSNRCGGLRHLRELFANPEHKAQCLALLKESDGDEESVLVSLLHELMHVTRQSANQEAAQEAARCLGEIGPVALNVIAIKGRSQNAAITKAVEKFGDSATYQSYCLLFHLLDQQLTSPSVAHVEAVSGVLKKLMCCEAGVRFQHEYKNRVDDSLFYFLHPFKNSKKKPTVHQAPEPHPTRLEEAELWCPGHAQHGAWIVALATALIQSGAVHDELLRLLAPVCKVKAEFCESVVPLLIHDMLLHGDDSVRQLLSRQVSLFFTNHVKLAKRQAQRTESKNETVSICMKKESIEALLMVVQYLRIQPRPPGGRGRVSTVWENNFWLDLDYLSLAQAALSCKAYFTSIMYAEIWCSAQRDARLEARRQGATRYQVVEQFSQNSPLEALEVTCGEQAAHAQQVLLSAYRSIGDPDAVYGCYRGARVAEPTARIQMYEHEGDWSRALSSYDVIMQEQKASAHLQPQLMQALYQQGSTHLLENYLQNTCRDVTRDDVTEMQYQAALRSMRWDLHTPTRLETVQGYQQALYTGVSALRQGDTGLSTRALQIARERTLDQLQGISLESARSCYPCLSALHCIAQIEDAIAVVDKRETLDIIVTKWQAQDALLSNDFEFSEPILSQRCTLLHVLGESRGEREEGNVRHVRRLMTHTEKLAVCAREAGRYQIAEGLLHKLRQLDSALGQSSWSWRVEECRLFWARGEQDIAKSLLHNMCDDMHLVYEGDTHARKWYPQCLSMLGDWLAETRAENPKVIMEEFLSKAVNVHETVDSPSADRLAAYLALARYADAQYMTIVNHMKSSQYEEKIALYHKAREEIEQLQSLGEERSRYFRTLQKQWSIDDLEEKAMLSDRKHYLQCAVQNYVRCLQHGDEHDLRVFRLASLWFDNSAMPEVAAFLHESLPGIASHKFLPLMCQLVARMNSAQQNTAFQTTLDALIERCSLDHPHHTLFIVLALAHAHKDDEVIQGRLSKRSISRAGRASTASQDSQLQDQGRVQAAKNLVDRLRKSRRAKEVTDLEQLCVAYIQLANYNVESFRKETKAINLPSSLQLIKLKNLTSVAMPTLDVPIDPSGRYDNIIHVQEFRPTFKLAGGLNLPKIISCVGSDGVARRQLVKGKDDLRQDSVMQQVFGMVNHLLNRDQPSRARKLTVRQYKVIPLSQRSGLLEWCEGTLPIGEYLIGSDGAHQRYRPHDLRAHECRKVFADAKDPKLKLTKYDAFMKACQNFQPVFRHFFWEKFPEPAEWYQRRLAYTRSVATNSIVGYILGLGDRHVQNILIDTRSAELVHIDLGVAFEQGRILPTPETVPFRLTRDIVDGMGVAGVEGVFRRCCEKTMSLMHASHEALLTILEVLLYDPLYAWTLSPEKAAQLQRTRDLDQTADVTMDTAEHEPGHRPSESRENVNKVAGRALLRLQQKLQGLEEGTQLSVHGQVNKLIQEARDPHNLCKLFPGWQPYI